MLRILITGANGFLGTALVRKLTGFSNIEVVALVRNKDSLSLTEENVRIIEVPNYFKFTKWKNALLNVDVVIHIAGVIPGQGKENSMFNINGELTELLVSKASHYGVKRFIFLSTFSVYGKDDYASKIELSTPVECTDSYPLSKLYGELAVRTVSEKSNMEWVIVRPPMIISENSKGAFYTLAKVFAKIGFSPFGKIKNKYGYIYIDTLILFLVKASLTAKVMKSTFLVSEKEDVSTKEIIDKISILLGGKKIKHLRIPLPILGFLAKALGGYKRYKGATRNLPIDSSLAWDVIESS